MEEPPVNWFGVGNNLMERGQGVTFVDHPDIEELEPSPVFDPFQDLKSGRMGMMVTVLRQEVYQGKVHFGSRDIDRLNVPEMKSCP